MPMVCPKCNGSFDTRLQCPACGVRLQYSDEEVRAKISSNTIVFEPNQWQQTPWGRIVVGLLLSQGIYFALSNLLSAGVLAAVGSFDEARDGVFGVLLSQFLQAIGLVVGGMLAGANQGRGFGYGAVVGVWNGAIFVGLVQAGVFPEKFQPSMNTVTLYGLPLVQMAFGALGGFVGGRIWKPLPLIEGAARKKAAPAPTRPSPFAGPVAWIRVMVGVALAVAGALSAKGILDHFIDTSRGRIQLETHLEEQIITWEITALALLCGGALAGATRFNPLKQGLCVGCMSAALLLGIRLAAPPFRIEDVILLGAAALGCCLGGSWFGGQLFPALPSTPRLRLGAV